MKKDQQICKKNWGNKIESLSKIATIGIFILSIVSTFYAVNVATKTINAITNENRLLNPTESDRAIPSKVTGQSH